MADGFRSWSASLSDCTGLDIKGRRLSFDFDDLVISISGGLLSVVLAADSACPTFSPISIIPVISRVLF